LHASGDGAHNRDIGTYAVETCHLSAVVTGVDWVQHVDVAVDSTTKDGVKRSETTKRWKVDSCSHLDWRECKVGFGELVTVTTVAVGSLGGVRWMVASGNHVTEWVVDKGACWANTSGGVGAGGVGERLLSEHIEDS